VLAFLSQAHLEPDLTIEIFLMDGVQVRAAADARHSAKGTRSEVVYHHIHEDLEKQGVIFTDMDTALRETAYSRCVAISSG
jgi:Fe-S cluster assembly scaffold protein SufB